MGLIPFVKDRVTLIFFEDGFLFGTLEIDATVSAQHKLHAQVTRHPVAKGASLTDNIRPDPDSLTLECFFTNRTGDIIQLAKRIGTLDFNHAESAFEQLEDAFRKGRTITIKMRIKTYEDMVIEDIGVPETVDDGNSVRATVTFTQIRTAIASTAIRVQAKPTAKGPPKAAGAKPKTPAAPPQKQSAAAHLVDNLGVSRNSTLFKKP